MLCDRCRPLPILIESQELLIIASYGTIIFHIVRHNLVRDGLPFGVAVAGFTFARVSYFWSPALWGGLFGQGFRTRTQPIVLFTLIAIGGLLAATAGPASAVLMLPRIHVSQA